MSRRSATLIVASMLITMLGMVGAFIRVPYVAMEPGPTSDTLGQVGKTPIIQISGAKTYPTGGHLNFVTISSRGDPRHRLDLFTALRGWLDPDVAIVPEETLYPKDVPAKQVEQENTQEMTSSQEAATAAAMNALHLPMTTTVVVESVQKGLPAAGRLRPGDQLTAIDGVTIKDTTTVNAAMAKHKPGDTVTFRVRRGGTETTVPVPTVISPDRTGDKVGKPVVGVMMAQRIQSPVSVKISVGDIGGPSAGLMFSLGIYDKLTPGALTGGRFIAGTGTITSDGVVGPIGGIEQKMIGARRAGATIFLTPAKNCAAAVGATPKGLRLVRVDTMDGALKALDALRTGQGPVPACPG